MRWIKNRTLVSSLHKKWKFFIKDFFSKCDQFRRKLRIWSRLLKKSLMLLHYIGRFVTLMHAYEPREHMFVPSAIGKAPALYHLNYDDPNKLAKRMMGYTDQNGNKKNTYVLEIWKILEVFNEKKLSCNLHYRPGSFRPTKLAVGKYFYPFCCNAHPFWIVFSTIQQLLLSFIYALMYWGGGIIISYYNFRRRGSHNQVN